MSRSVFALASSALLLLALSVRAPAQDAPSGVAEVVAGIKKLGGDVSFDRADASKPWGVSLNGLELTEKHLKMVASLAPLNTLSLKRAVIPAAGLKHVGKLKGLAYLDLMDTSLSDDKLEAVAGLTKLKTLVLGLNPAVTDAGLRHLKKLSALEDLNLAGCKVTDEGLKELAGLTRLKSVNLTGTRVTRVGVEYLERAVPGVRVTHLLTR